MSRDSLTTSALALAALLLVASSSAAATRAPAPDPQVRAWIVEADRLQSLRQWSASDSLARLAAARVDSATPRDSAALAYALYQSTNARMATLVSRDSLTLTTLERAIAIHARMSRPDTAQWIRETSLISRLYFDADRPDVALRSLAGGRSLCTPTLAASDSILGELWMYTGRYQRRLGRLDLSADALEQSRALRTRAFGPMHPLIAETLTELGALQSQRFEVAEAQTTLDEAIRIYERTLGPTARQLTIPLGHLASLQYQLGDVAGSIESLERQIALYVAERGPETPFAFPARFNRCTRLFDFGDYRGALQEYQRLLAIGVREFGPTHSRVRDVLVYAGAAAVECGDSSAGGYLARARALYKTPDPRSTDAHAARWEAERLRLAGHPAAALALVDSQFVMVRPRPLDEWVRVPLLETRMESAIALGDRATVRRTIAQLDSLVAARPGADDALISESRRTTSRGYAWLGDRDEAWRRALAIESIERRRLRNNMRALPDRRALEFQNELARPLDLLLTLAASSHDTARVAIAWDRLVRWRGMVSAEMEQRRLPRAAANDSAVVAAHDRWLASRGDLARLEVAALTSGDPAALARLAVQRLATDEAERHYAVAAGPFASDTAEVTLAAVRAALAERTALVSLVELAPRTDSTRILAFVVRGMNGPIAWFDLGPRRELEAWVARWRGAISRPPARGAERAADRDLATLGDEVRDRTWGRFVKVLGDAGDVVIVSDGTLAGLPWGALPAKGGRYLVETGPRIATPAAERDLLARREQVGMRLLAFGDPDFAELSPGVLAASQGEGATLAGAATRFAPAFRSPLSACAGAGGFTLASLPGARAEVLDVAKEWTAAGGQAVTRVGGEATERSIKLEAPGCTVLHLATHGIVWGDSCTRVAGNLRGIGGAEPYALAQPMKGRHLQASPSIASPASTGDSGPPAPGSGRRVWLALAGANHASSASDDNDGLLTAEEVSSLDLRSVDWVVLSACQSAVGETWPREGSLGMQRAFRLAGAREVIASHWPIGDESTREWMRALYEARARGARDGTDALVAADRAVLAARRSSHRTTHPFYWAAFTASGR